MGQGMGQEIGGRKWNRKWGRKLDRKWGAEMEQEMRHKLMCNLILFSLAVQLAKIDRYESRLTSMAYMGNFDELLNSAQPVSTKLPLSIEDTVKSL